MSETETTLEKRHRPESDLAARSDLTETAADRSATPLDHIAQLHARFGNAAVGRAMADETGTVELMENTGIQLAVGDATQFQSDAGEGENNQGLPSQLKAGLQQLSGMDLSGIRVHSNSSKPAQLNALAYTQGRDIHVGPTQEEHLPHEGWHAVQQMQGRVAPTTQARGVSINDDKELEREADVMGAKAVQTLPRTQRPEGRNPGARQPRIIQRWSSPEHMRLGDVTKIEIDIGQGVSLSFGQVVALAGDEFGSLEELENATTTSVDRAMIRAHLERAKVAGHSASRLPEPTDPQRTQAIGEYIALATENTAHFAGGGTAVKNWLDHHALAIDRAIRAGMYSAPKDGAYMAEAFGIHFLTDAFSSGHIRVPRAEITEYYVGEFAPRVVDHLIEYLTDRLIDEIYDQVEKQTVLNEAAWLFGILGGLSVRAYMRNEIEDAIDSELAKMVGDRQTITRYLGLGLAGIVAGAMHDMENRDGLQVLSDIDQRPWHAYGDGKLEKNPDHKTRVEEAVRASVADVDAAYAIGVEEGYVLPNIVEPQWLPDVVHFEFDSVALDPAANGLVDSVADYLLYNTATILNLVGHADPIGDEPDNHDLGLRRAFRIAQRIMGSGVDASRISIESMGETALVSTDPPSYNLNRRVDFTYLTSADEYDMGPDDVAYEKALQRVLSQVGPHYVAERHLPWAADGLNNDLPAWQWGSIPGSLQTEMNKMIVAYVNEYASKMIQSLEPIPVDDYTVNPRPIAQGIVDDIKADPVRFLERALGSSAGSP